MDDLSGLERHDGQTGDSPIFWFTISCPLVQGLSWPL